MSIPQKEKINQHESTEIRQEDILVSRVLDQGNDLVYRVLKSTYSTTQYYHY